MTELNKVPISSLTGPIGRQGNTNLDLLLEGTALWDIQINMRVTHALWDDLMERFAVSGPRFD